MPADKKEIVTEWIHAYGDSVLRMCYLYLKDYQLAEDVMQETFLIVLHKYDTFRQQSSVKTWIVKIAINLCKSQMRTKWFATKKQDTFPELSFEENYDGMLDRAVLITEIGNLKPKYKEVILKLDPMSAIEVKSVEGEPNEDGYLQKSYPGLDKLEEELGVTVLTSPMAEGNPYVKVWYERLGDTCHIIHLDDYIMGDLEDIDRKSVV